MESDQFSQKEWVSIQELASLYIQAKSLIIYAEESDPDSRSNIQIIKELRDAFDHFMRVVVSRTDPDSPHHQEPDYGETNINKAMGHVYRATFDALDGTVVSLREKIVALLEPYSPEVIKDIIPDYWNIRIKLEELTQRVAAHRAKKDVGQGVAEVLNDYITDVETLKIFHTKLLNSAAALSECHRRYRGGETKKFYRQLLVGLVCVIIGWGLKSMIQPSPTQAVPPPFATPAKMR